MWAVHLAMRATGAPDAASRYTIFSNCLSEVLQIFGSTSKQVMDVFLLLLMFLRSVCSFFD